MPNTYTQIYIQLVFAVKYRQSLIHEAFREELQKYMTGTIQNRNTFLVAIYCMPDHVHILVRISPTVEISALVHQIKISSTKFINEKGWIRTRFAWQEGFGAFSYSSSHVNNVIRYIENQQEHHRTKIFRDEYLALLQEFNVDYRDQYLFEWHDDPK